MTTIKNNIALVHFEHNYKVIILYSLLQNKISVVCYICDNTIVSKTTSKYTFKHTLNTILGLFITKSIKWLQNAEI